MLPNINTPIEIYDVEANKTFKSIISDITNEQVLIASPMDNLNLVFYEPGSTIEISYTEDGSKYAFTTDILGSLRDIILLYIVKKPTEKDIQRVQRRQYFRMESSLKVECDLGIFTTLDIGGGGLRCSYPSDLNIEVGKELDGTLYLPRGNSKVIDAIPFKGQVLRLLPPDLGDNKTFAMGFTQINERYREKIIQYCLWLQLQMRR